MKPEKVRQLVGLLGRIKWPVPPEVFNALLGAIPTVAIELVAFKDGKVVLFPRPEDDPFFAGKVHFAGTVIRRGDTEASALTRAAEELGNAAWPTPPRFVDRHHVPMGTGKMQCPRGQEISLVFTCDVKGELPANAILAAWCDLPKNLIDFQGPIIEKVMIWRNKKP
jgi:hypothetical protein